MEAPLGVDADGAELRVGDQVKHDFGATGTINGITLAPAGSGLLDMFNISWHCSPSEAPAPTASSQHLHKIEKGKARKVSRLFPATEDAPAAAAPPATEAAPAAAAPPVEELRRATGHLVGSRISVWWNGDRKWYNARVVQFDPHTGKCHGRMWCSME